ncbi:MAG: gfo/Idh/MocA family oxidoreductase [Planctomycetia bacterium]|nr:gfo/Idh/MocA family oxidoreductase [Planctomycetia bacterium]
MSRSLRFVRPSRRRFLAAAGATAAAHRALLLAGEPAGGSAPSASPSDGPGIGVVGLRYQGSVIAARAKAHGRIVGIADVDRDCLDLTIIDKNVKSQTGMTPEEIYGGVAAADRHQDYRRLLDDPRIGVILIGTPDHWHAKMLIDAVKAGKDVYCEKPLSLTIDEGKQMRKAVRDTGRIVQVGSWHRSDARFRLAVEMIRQGRLGKLEKVEVVLGKNKAGGPFAARSVPANLDWNLWQGQTPDVPYVPERTHYTFRWWQAYSGGQLTDWGAHHVDIARWAIDAEPVEIEGKATYPTTAGGYDVPLDYFVRYRFANGVEMTVDDTGRNGIMFTGSEGRLFVNRENVTGKPVEDLKDRPLPREAFTLYDFDNRSRPERSGKIEAIMNHMGNFFDCVAARRQPIADVESGHRSVSVCHLGNSSCKLGRPLKWDPAAERFVGDSEADALLSRPQRKGFETQA